MWVSQHSCASRTSIRQFTRVYYNFLSCCLRFLFSSFSRPLRHRRLLLLFLFSYFLFSSLLLLLLPFVFPFTHTHTHSQDRRHQSCILLHAWPLKGQLGEDVGKCSTRGAIAGLAVGSLPLSMAFASSSFSSISFLFLPVVCFASSEGTIFVYSGLCGWACTCLLYTSRCV